MASFSISMYFCASLSLCLYLFLYSVQPTPSTWGSGSLSVMILRSTSIALIPFLLGTTVTVIIHIQGVSWCCNHWQMIGSPIWSLSCPRDQNLPDCGGLGTHATPLGCGISAVKYLHGSCPFSVQPVLCLLTEHWSSGLSMRIKTKTQLMRFKAFVAVVCSWSFLKNKSWLINCKYFQMAACKLIAAFFDNPPGGVHCEHFTIFVA